MDIPKEMVLKTAWDFVHTSLVEALDSAAAIGELIPHHHPKAGPAREFLADCTAQLRSSLDWMSKFQSFHYSHKEYQGFLVRHWIKAMKLATTKAKPSQEDRKMFANNAIFEIKKLIAPVTEFMHKVDTMPEISIDKEKQYQNYAALQDFLHKPLDLHVSGNNFSNLLRNEDAAQMALSEHQKDVVNPIRARLAQVIFELGVIKDYLAHAASDESSARVRFLDLQDFSNQMDKSDADSAAGARFARDQARLLREAAAADLGKACRNKANLDKRLADSKEELRKLRDTLLTEEMQEKLLLTEYEQFAEEVELVREAMLAEKRRFPGKSSAEIITLSEGIKSFQKKEGLSSQQTLKELILNYLRIRDTTLSSLQNQWEAELAGSGVDHYIFLSEVVDKVVQGLKFENISIDMVVQYLKHDPGAVGLTKEQLARTAAFFS